jgi:murein DD-endopeptidase MepM/ murein hydrolase activator NlpD
MPLIADIMNQSMDQNTSSAGTGVSNDIAARTANMIWPVKSGYVSRSVAGRHTGTDMIASEGTPIYAVLDGTVEIVTDGGKNFRGYGNTTIINHDSKLWSLYAHCSALYVRVGQHVKCGDKIAAVGSTGRVTTAHLHFELRDSNGNPLDALKYLPAEGALPQTYVKH